MLASGGYPPYKFSLDSGVLPAGLVFNATSGQLTGTPSEAGDFTFSVRVSDSGPASAGPASTLIQGYHLVILPWLNAVTNAASYLTGSVSPGEIITVFGAGIGPKTTATYTLDDQRRISTSLSQTRVLFD